LLLEYGSDVHARDGESRALHESGSKRASRHYAVTVGARSGGSSEVIRTDGLDDLV
jgi:hypothetical protein